MSKGIDKKPHIVIMGRCNTGKSSLMNAIVGQEIAIVSDVSGTTTDPVKKSVELLGIGAVVLIDTAGIDDLSSIVGNKRVEKSTDMIERADLVLLVTANNKFGDYERDIIEKLKKRDTPCIVVYNKSDVMPMSDELFIQLAHEEPINISAKRGDGIEQLIDEIKERLPENSYNNNSITRGLVSQGEVILLVTPIDSEAPEGRLILPQVQMIRDLLDNDCIAVVAKVKEAATFLKMLRPKLVITDSQVFKEVSEIVPNDIPLTSFSMLLAYSKGSFELYKEGIQKVDDLKDGDRILILESCSHTVSCEDIGRNKIPTMLTKYTGKRLEFKIVAGLSPLPQDLSSFALVIQCGGCVITKKQIKNRINSVVQEGVAVTNYGMIIAFMAGIYNRAIDSLK